MKGADGTNTRARRSSSEMTSTAAEPVRSKALCSVLVAPVLEEAKRENTVRLPKGTWVDWWTDRAYDGGQTVTVDAPPGSDYPLHGGRFFDEDDGVFHIKRRTDILSSLPIWAHCMHGPGESRNTEDVQGPRERGERFL